MYDNSCHTIFVNNEEKTMHNVTVKTIAGSETMKTTGEITLHDLMAEDVSVWIGKDKKFGFNLEIEDENGDPMVEEQGIHPYAADSLATFCKHYLACYERAKKQ